MERNEFGFKMGMNMVEASGVSSLLIYKDAMGKIQIMRSKFGGDQDLKELLDCLIKASFLGLNGVDAKEVLRKAVDELDDATVL